MFERNCFTNVLRMITIKGDILPHQKKKDGTWNVKIRITYQRVSKYLPTNMFVAAEHLNTKKTEIKSKEKLKKIGLIEDEYREMVEDIAITESLDTKKIIDYIAKRLQKKKNSEVDFADFISGIITTRKIAAAAINEKDKVATGYQTVLNSLKDFFKSDKILITQITAKRLKGFEEYLKTQRKVLRPDKHGVLVERTLEPVNNGINNYMRDIRALFNDAVEAYNDEDENEIIIHHTPFKKYKIPKPEPSQKRALKIEVIKKIRDINLDEDSGLKVLGRDVFMMSFYLVGINNKDLFKATRLKNGKLTYNRSKTEKRREDKALIEIKIEPEISDLLIKYADPEGRRVFNFYHQYKNIDNFNRAVNTGLHQISEDLNLGKKVTSGYARTSWGTIARNKCKISKDDVDLALNHIDPRHKLVDMYIEKDFSLIDEANRKVLDTLR